ncbi:MAG: serine hydrolase domain-containing protein [Anaerolineales bacterium]
MSGFENVFARLDQLVEERMRISNVPGVAMALTNREKPIRVTTYGYSDVGAKSPVTQETLFRIGSITKSFTCIVLLQLQEEGLLDLHQPVAHYLPWFNVKSDYGPITLHHLMSHTAGIIAGADFTCESLYEIWALRQMEAAAPPGRHYHYSSLGYRVLGVILEDLLGSSHRDIIQGRILDPLGMSDTAPSVTQEIRRQLAVGYEASYDDRPMAPDRALVPATWVEYTGADGCIASTPADMAAYVRMFLNLGKVANKTILSTESLNLMIKPVIEVVNEEEVYSYGYGLRIRQIDDHIIVGHSGGMLGFYSHFCADIQEGLGTVVLMNGPEGHPDEIAMFALRLLRAGLHGEALPSPPLIDPMILEDAADYAGTYRRVLEHGSPEARSGGQRFKAKTLTLVAEGNRLFFLLGDDRIALEKRGPDRFCVCHPDFSCFPLSFGRENGNVAEAFYGSGWFINDRYSGPTAFDYPQVWHAYIGHYRSHNPWLSNFWVIPRKGNLMLIQYPFNPSGQELALVPIGEGVFLVGEDHRSPERIRFDVILNGHALHANLSCGDYYRTPNYEAVHMNRLPHRPM